MQVGYELALLSVYAFVMGGLLILQAGLATRQLGVKYILSPRDKRERLTGFAGRADRAMQNCIVAMALFAPAVLAVQVQGQNSALTMLAAQVFVLSRIVYVASYLAGIRYVRSAAFGLGFLATMYLYIAAL